MTDTQAEKPQSNAASVFLTFLKLGLTSFGGPIAHLGYFRKELVERQKWISDSQFSQLLAICQFLPGPASSQLGFALGLLRAGWIGAIAAFTAFTLPSALILIAFASLLPLLSGSIADAAIHGLKLVACAVVADAVLGMSKKLCPDSTRRAIAILAASILLLAGSAWFQILVVIGGAAAGILLLRDNMLANDSQINLPYGKGLATALITTFVFLLIALPWFAPSQPSLIAIADAFYRAGALVFGGGHVVLPLLEDSTVASGWISEETFLAGYGAAQAIPGPMFAFSAYLGALVPAGSSAWTTAFIALLFMFLPGFLLLAAVLPVWQRISRNAVASRAVAGVNAAVVGLLGAALYDPIFTSGIGSTTDLAIGLIAFGLLTVWKLSPLYIVLWCVSASVIPVLI